MRFLKLYAQKKRPSGGAFDQLAVAKSWSSMRHRLPWNGIKRPSANIILSYWYTHFYSCYYFLFLSLRQIWLTIKLISYIKRDDKLNNILYYLHHILHWKSIEHIKQTRLLISILITLQQMWNMDKALNQNVNNRNVCKYNILSNSRILARIYSDRNGEMIWKR